MVRTAFLVVITAKHTKIRGGLYLNLKIMNILIITEGDHRYRQTKLPDLTIYTVGHTDKNLSGIRGCTFHKVEVFGDPSVEAMQLSVAPCVVTQPLDERGKPPIYFM